jgi:hypothetical protein
MIVATLFLAVLAPSAGIGPAPERFPATVAPQEQALACVAMLTDRLPLESRKSPLDSITFHVQGSPVKICYGRPSARGRAIFGALVPYGELWRTGANEPTMIHTSVAIKVAGIELAPGSYSLYTIPGESEWVVIVNRSTSQWGHESRYTADVEAQEVARAKVEAGTTGEHVETLTIEARAASRGNAVVTLEWERTRVEIPISAGA